MLRLVIVMHKFIPFFCTLEFALMVERDWRHYNRKRIEIKKSTESHCLNSIRYALEHCRRYHQQVGETMGITVTLPGCQCKYVFYWEYIYIYITL